jgi:hypothetical protein
MEALLDVVSVVAGEDYTLLLVFENGERSPFDVKPLLDKKPFARLKDLPPFLKATVAFGTVVWPGTTLRLRPFGTSRNLYSPL